MLIKFSVDGRGFRSGSGVVGRWRQALFGILSLAAMLLSGHAEAAAPAVPAACLALQAKYPDLVGKPVKVALDGLQRPFTYHDPQNPDKIIGVDIELAKATFDCLGVPWTQSIGVWAGLITSVTEGRNDVMWDTLNYTPARAKQVNYVLYLSAATGFLVHAGNPKHVDSLDSICGLNAAAGLGTVEEAAFHDQGKKCVSMGKPDINLVTYTDLNAGLRQVANGRVDVIMTDLAMSNILVADQPQNISLAFSILSGFHVGLAVNKGKTELLEAIAEALKVVQASGQEKAILSRYKVDPSLEYPVEVKTE
jgi:polar amino acid transport system substrate-binding protein